MKRFLFGLFAVSCSLLMTVAAYAQDVQPAGNTAPPPTSDDRPTFMSRFGSYLEFGALRSDSPYFQLHARVAIDVDAWDYGRGRVNFLANHETVIGTPGHRGKVSSVNYWFQVSASYRTSLGVEVAGDVEHVCNDLTNTAAAAPSWNSAGVVIRRHFTPRRQIIYASIKLNKVIDRFHTDMKWTSQLRLSARQAMTKTLSLYGSAVGDAVGVVQTSLPLRNRQYGAAFEGGVHISGFKADVELFGSYERRIDAYPTERQRRRMVSIGIRLCGK